MQGKSVANPSEIQGLYRNILGRAADPSGLRTYAGMSPDQVRSALLGSPEYAKRQQNQTNAPVKFAEKSNKQFDALLARQRKEEQGLFGQYTQAIAGQEKLPDMYTRLQGELGLPDLNQQAQAYKDEIYRTKGLLDRLDDNVTNRNIGTYATQALRDRIYASEGEDLRTDLSRLGTGLEPISDMITSAQGQLQTLLPLHMQQQERELKPLELQIDKISDRFAREITGFTSNRETMLTALGMKWQREQDLADREWDLMQQLAAEERQFKRQKSLVQTSVSQYLQPQQQQTQGAQSNQPLSTRQLPALPKTPVNQIPGSQNIPAFRNYGGGGSSGDPLNVMGMLSR